MPAICDHNERFLDVDASWTGCSHDSSIFRSSDAFEKFVTGQLDGILIGDSGYPILPFSMKIYPNPTTAEQRNFNRIITRARIHIEQAFGQVKRRFYCLSAGLRMELDRRCRTIVAAFILHNICKDADDPVFFGPDEDQHEEAEENLVAEEEAVQNNFPVANGPVMRQLGEERRNELCTQLYNGNQQ